MEIFEKCHGIFKIMFGKNFFQHFLRDFHEDICSFPTQIESIIERIFQTRYGLSHEEMIERKAPLYKRPDVEQPERKIESRRRTNSCSAKSNIIEVPLRRSRSATAIVVDSVASIEETRQNQAELKIVALTRLFNANFYF